MIRRILIPLLVLAALTTAVGVAAPTADAGTQVPCWKRLLNDWYDGRIDNAYQVHCYREAIRNLPDDVDAYTEAREEIERALMAAIRRSGGEMAPTDTVPAPGAGFGRGNGSPGTDTGPGTTTGGPGDETPPDENEAEPPEAAPGDEEDDGFIGFFRPSNADEIPLPLLVLAGLALALLAAAALGFAARRVQARRLSARPAPPDA